MGRDQIGMQVRVLTVVMLAVLVAACGGTRGEETDQGCEGACYDLREKLIQQMPDVSPQDVVCSEWAEYRTCDACIQMIRNRYDASVSGRDAFCEAYFSGLPF